MKRLLCFCPLLILLISNWQQSGDAIDLLEAYEIAYAEAMEWDVSVKPYFITSVDDSIESKKVKGEDGKRNCWNFDFVVENTNQHLIITLHDKTVVNKIEAESYVNRDCIINMEDLCLSTANAVAVAKETYGLLPGTAWAQGYHFVLENDGSVLILSVVGLDEDGAMSRVFFNAKTRQVIH